MKTIELGNSGVRVSPIIMGCWGIAGGYTWGDQDEKESIDTIRAAIDCGVTTFDTAEFYSEGYSEEVLGKGLGADRKNAVIATKIWTTNMAGDRVAAAVNGSLKRLNTDYIDLLQIHWLDPELKVEETLKAMEKMKESGKVRAIGVCNHGCSQLAEALETSEIVTNQLSYSLFFRAIEFEIADYCKQNNVGILAYSPLAQGLLTGKFRKPEDVNDERARLRFYSKDRPGTVHQEPGCEKEIFSAIEKIENVCRENSLSMGNAAISWLLQKSEVSAVIVGARNPKQMIRNAEAMELRLSDELVVKLDELTRPVKSKLGPNADPWRTESRIV